LIVASALILGWLCYGFYELRRSAWWATLALTLFWTAACLVTFLRVPGEELFLAAGLEEEQVDMLRGMGMATTGSLVWGTVLSAVTMLAYLLYLWKYFPPRQEPRTLPTAP
jgi:hypothetical protein